MQAAVEIPVAFQLQSSNQVRYGMAPNSTEVPCSITALREHGDHDLWGQGFRSADWAGQMADGRCQMVYPQTSTVHKRTPGLFGSSVPHCQERCKQASLRYEYSDKASLGI